MTSKSNPNPLFTKWLTEWRNGSKDVGSKMQFVYNKALKSLREHPNVLKTGEECRQLKGFGEKLCKRIDHKLAEVNGVSNVNNNDSNEETVPQNNRQITDLFKQKKKRTHKKTTTGDGESPLPKVAKTKSNRSNANYIPSEGSGSYAILMALIKAEVEEGIESLGKQDLQDSAQEFTTTSMTIGVNGSHYSGWNSIKTLLNKNLIERNDQRLASYFLTQTGRELATKLLRIYSEKQNNEMFSDMSDPEAIIPNIPLTNHLRDNESQSSTQSSATNERFSLAANTYDIILCVDTREQASGVNKEVKKTALMSVLQQNGVKVEIRTLSVGDFVWIAKQRTDLRQNMCPINTINNRSRKELVLDYVIERKRIDDLASSIKDRRWDEQKYRLINCGVRKPSYVIEYFNGRRGDFGGINCDTLDQAITNAQVDGFSVKRCDGYDDTVRYLTLMTRYLESQFNNKTIISCLREELIKKEVPNNHFMTYTEFERNSNKISNFTANEMFLKHLLQMRGVSVSKAKVIVDHYPTLQSLLDAYSIANTIKSKENLLSSLKCGPMERNFGPNLSKKIYIHYNH